ncbi:MAG: G8 domain-containing protein [Pseudomonadota bacterium]
MRLLALSLLFLTVAANAGNWSDPASWPGGVPGTGENVTIPAGQLITLDVSPPPLGSLDIMGTLAFADQDLRLEVARIMIHNGGALEVGTSAQPFTANAVIELTEPDLGSGAMGNRVLGVMGGGSLSLHGASAAKTSWTQLAADVNPGDTELTLANAPGWSIGDEIVIAASGFHAEEAEKLTITAIDENTVSFTPALAFPHLGHVKTIVGRDLDVRAEVGLLTRNVRIQAPESSEADHFGFHAMFMPLSQVQISGVEMTRGGQLRKQGRYPAHWHGPSEPGLDASGSYIRDTSIHNSFQRGVVTHEVNNVLVSDNVVYDVWGHAYVPSETGTEVGNAYLRNLAVLYKRRPNEDFSFPRDDHTESDQAEHRPSGFWMRSYHNIIEDNHAAGGAQGIGFFFDSQVIGHRDQQFIVYNETPNIFRGNVAHSHYRVLPGGGIPTYGPKTRTSGLMVTHYAGLGKNVVFEQFTAYKNSLAGAWLENRNHTFRDSIIADSSMAIFNHQSNIENIVAIQQTDNLIGGENQIIGNRRHLGGGMHFQGGRRGGDNPRVDNVTFVGFEPGAFTMWKDVLDTSPYLRASNITLIDTPGFWYMGREGVDLEDSLMIDVDGTVSGTGQLTYIGGRNIATDATFMVEYNAYMSVRATSNDLFRDSFETPN